MDRLVQDHLEDIRRIAHQHGATRIRVIGSRARNDAGPDSDLDLLIDLEKGRDLFDLIAIQQDLEEFLGCNVDVGQGFHEHIDESKALEGAVEL